MNCCRICGSENEISNFSIKGRVYAECNVCGSITVLPESFISETEQRERYEMHHNSLSDAGYRAFLESFINPVLEEISCCESGSSRTERKAEKTSKTKQQQCKIKKILDYGSGPEPALCELLHEYAENGRYIDKSCEIRGWDPFFASSTAFFSNGADLVTCLEVAEHFEHPVEDMKKLSDACHTGCHVAIGTMLLPSENQSDKHDDKRELFRKWWYRSDSTHVSFYTLDGLKKCADKAGLTFLKQVTERVFLFQKR